MHAPLSLAFAVSYVRAGITIGQLNGELVQVSYQRTGSRVTGDGKPRPTKGAKPDSNRNEGVHAKYTRET